MTTIIGYARASSEDQDCTIQEQALKAAGCTTVRSEKRSGTTREGRDELATVLEFLRTNDTLVVTRIDRLARSVKDLEDIVAAIRAKGAHLKVTEQPVDTSTAAGVAFFQMLGVLPNSRRPCARSARWRVSRRPRLRGSTGAGSPRCRSTPFGAFMKPGPDPAT